jgi:hypothetical protein
VSNPRKVGVAMAIAGSIVGLALAVVAPGAAADELSDLRANSELLQRRLDQIDSASTNPAGGGSAQTAVSPAAAGGSFPRSFLVPGTDTSVRVGGDISETFGYGAKGRSR